MEAYTVALASIGAVVIVTPAALLFRWLRNQADLEVVGCCGRNGQHHLCGYDGPCSTSKPNSGSEVVVYCAKHIETMNITWPAGKVVAVQDGRVVSVGDSLDDLKPWLERKGYSYRVDSQFKDAVILPGFIEQHNHPLLGGVALSMPCVAYHSTPTPFGKDIPGCKNKAEALDRMKEVAAKQKEGVLFAWGWDTVAMGGHLRASDLDLVDQTRSVLVWDCSMHFAYINNFAIKDIGLSYAKHGHINGVQTENGTLTGALLGIDAMSLLKKFMSLNMQPKKALKSMHYITELARAGGVTTMCELMHGGVNAVLERPLYDYFFILNSPCRCVMVTDAKKLVASSFGITSWAVSFLKRQVLLSTEKLIFNNAVKFFTDDAFLGLSMAMGFPGYTDGHKGLYNCGELGAPYFRRMLPFWKAGCRIHVHSNGDAAQDVTAEVLESLQTAHPRFNHRFCFEHYGMSNMAVNRRLAALGASAAINSYYISLRGALNVPHMGKDRAHSVAALKSLLNARVPVALHTDTPVAPPRPLEEIWNVCCRKSLETGEVMNKNETVSVYEALRMKTVEAAYVHGLDGLLGSIEPGKFADFVVLDKNPLDVEPEAIRNIKILATVVSGKTYLSQPLPEWCDPVPAGLLSGLVYLKVKLSRGGLAACFWRMIARLVGVKIDDAPSRSANVEGGQLSEPLLQPAVSS